MIRFGSVCSGIEAASVGWEPLGWKAAWFSEIEPFPSAVLAHHWPDTPNLGDMTFIPQRILAGEIEAPDVFCGGTPCQAFSIAGNRDSLGDARGNLSLIFCETANAIDDVRHSRGEAESVIFWENVPGVLSTHDNAFGCFLAGLAGDECALELGLRPQQTISTAHWTWKADSREHIPKWPDAGIVIGPRRAVAWRVLDAQFFGLAQRRRRVFVVGSAREGFNPAEVLLEFDGMRRDSPPSREAREEIAGTLTASLGKRNGIPNCGSTAGQLMPVDAFRMVAFGEYSEDGTASTMKARDYKDATDLVAMANVSVVHGTQDPCTGENVAFTLGCNSGQENAVLAFRACGQEGFTPSDISPPIIASDGGGSGVPTVAYAFAENSRAELRLENGDGCITGALSTGGGNPGQGMPCIITHPICTTGNIAHTLTGEGFDASEDGTGRGTPIVPSVTYGIPGNWIGRSPANGGNATEPHFDRSPCLTATDRHGVATSDMAVRRLTVTECARLQGFPDNHCRIPDDRLKKIEADMLAYLMHHHPDLSEGEIRSLAVDGPQYKAYGNSWAVACTSWIGARIDAKLRELDGEL